MPKQYRYGGKVYNLPDDTSDADALAFIDAQHEGEAAGERVSNLPGMDTSPSLLDRAKQGIKWMFTPKVTADQLAAERHDPAHPMPSRFPELGSETHKPQGFLSERELDEAAASMTSPINIGLAVAGDPFIAGTSKAATIASRVASGAAGVQGVLQGEREAEEGHPVAGILNAGAGAIGAYGAGKGIAPETGENLMNRVIGTDVNALDAGINPGAALVRRGLNANSAESLLEKVHEARVTDPHSPALIEAEQSLAHKINASKLRPALGMSDWATGAGVLGMTELAGGAQTAIKHPVATAATVATGMAAKKVLGSTPIASRVATYLGRQSLPPDLSPEVPEFLEGEYLNHEPPTDFNAMNPPNPMGPEGASSRIGGVRPGREMVPVQTGQPQGHFSMPESPLPKQKLLDRVSQPMLQSKGAQGAEATRRAFAAQGLNITLEQAENDVVNQAAQARAALGHIAKSDPELAKALETHPDFAPLFATADEITSRRSTNVTGRNEATNPEAPNGGAPEVGEGNGGLQGVHPEARGTLAEKVNGKVGEGATPPVESPEMITLYHGTRFENGPGIAREGLKPNTDMDEVWGPFATTSPDLATSFAGSGGHVIKFQLPANELPNSDHLEINLAGRSIPPEQIEHYKTNDYPKRGEGYVDWDDDDKISRQVEHAENQTLQDKMRANLEAHSEVADSTRNKLFYAGNKPDYDPMIGEWEGGAPTLFDYLDDLRRRQPRQR